MKKENVLSTMIDAVIRDNREFILGNGGNVANYLVDQVQNTDANWYLTDEEINEIDEEKQTVNYNEVVAFLYENYDYYLELHEDDEIAQDKYLVAEFYNECTRKGGFGHNRDAFNARIVKGMDAVYERMRQLALEDDNVICIGTLDEAEEEKEFYREEEREIPEWLKNYDGEGFLLIKNSEVLFNNKENESMYMGDYTIRFYPVCEALEKCNISDWSNKVMDKETLYRDLRNC